jgi:hypothetical protein
MKQRKSKYYKKVWYVSTYGQGVRWQIYERHWLSDKCMTCGGSLSTDEADEMLKELNGE